MPIKSPSIGNKEAFYQGYLRRLGLLFPFFPPFFNISKSKKEVFPTEEGKWAVLSIRNFWTGIAHKKAPKNHVKVILFCCTSRFCYNLKPTAETIFLSQGAQTCFWGNTFAVFFAENIKNVFLRL